MKAGRVIGRRVAENWPASRTLYMIHRMQVDAPESVERPEPDAVEAGWFAARQPGIIRFLEQHLAAPDGDALGAALAGAWRLVTAFERRDGVSPSRVDRSLLDRAARAVAAEARHGAADGCAARQPELCTWLIGWLADPPAALTADETARVGAALAAVIYALDQVTTGRPIP
jgi:hypothetical protein